MVKVRVRAPLDKVLNTTKMKNKGRSKTVSKYQGFIKFEEKAILVMLQAIDNWSRRAELNRRPTDYELEGL
jgi:hypothetical protein